MNTETAIDPRSALEEGERMVARVWRLLALRGAVAIIFGFVLLVWPDIGLTAMTTVVGAFAIASGFVAGVAAYALSGATTQHRLWLGFNSIVGLAVGVARARVARPVGEGAAVRNRDLGDRDGRDRALRCVRAAAERRADGAGRGEWNRDGGVRHRHVRRADEGAIALLALVAAFALVRGTFDIALAVELRRVLGELKERLRSPARPKPVAHG